MQEQRPDERKQLRRNGLWNAFGNLVYLGLQWLITIYVVRKGGYSDAGYLSLAMSSTGTLQNFAHFGIRNYQISDLHGKYSDKEYRMVRYWTCLGSYIVCIGFVLFNRYSGAQAASILCFMLFRLIESFSDVLQGIAQKNGRLDVAGKSFFLRGTAGFAGFCLLYQQTANLWISLLGMAGISALCVVFYDWRKIRSMPGDWEHGSRNRAIGMLRECLPLCLYLFCSAAITTLPRILLEKEYGTEALGIYASVFAPAMLIQAGAGYLFLPFLPVFAEDHFHGRKKEFRSRFIKLSGIIGGVFVVIFLLGKLAGPQVLQIIIGERIRGYEFLLDGVLVCTLLTAYTSFLCALLTVIRNFRILLFGTVSALVGCIVVTPVFLGRFGIGGTSDAIAAAFVLMAILTLPAIFKSKEKKDGRHQQRNGG